MDLELELGYQAQLHNEMEYDDVNGLGYGDGSNGYDNGYNGDNGDGVGLEQEDEDNTPIFNPDY